MSQLSADITTRTIVDMSEEVRERMLAADRLDSLADTAELMNDPDGARRLREFAAVCRLRAMELLDE